MSTSRKVRDYFELVSPQWDVMRKNLYGEEVREAVLNAVHVSASDTVLDVGSGTGFLTEAVAKIAAKIIALDFSRGMSEEAIAKMGEGNVEFRIGNVESMPLQDSSVDVVIGNMVLHHCPHPEIAISEISRVLKPRGRIAISDLQEHSYEWLRKEHADLWLGFRMEEVAAMMKKNGLDNVKVDALSSCCSSVQEEQQIKIPMFLASALKRDSRERKLVV
ncbi:MAG TPA: class I SAM-dependent methyltransferase [Candidatus Bathyarchaeia archaeon]|nr:class I SAM-dependent methyltransferase [Candidatus Bathyarchaeia archaeon]